MKGYPVFLHHKQNKALHKAARAMDSKTNIQCIKLMQLENSMSIYGFYNAETLEKLINTVHNIHNMTSSHEKLFAGQQSSLTLRSLYANSLSFHHYSINFTVILENSAGQIYCTIQGINNPAAHIQINN